MLRTAVTATAAVAILAVSAPLGQAAPAGPVDAADRTSTVREFTVASGTRWAVCTARAEAPRWSRSAGSVVYTTRVTCRGNINRVRVRVVGRLVRSGSGTVATSDEFKVITTNGGTATYDTPRGGAKVRRPGTFRGASTVQITAPVRGTRGTTSSKAQYVRVP
ncbi:hypothetical protein GCM10020221_05010 [Streptomyces thioluteus]|uniref:DUF11 domain-containing protein n=1 Tax=Streptomyces thioluteus TaxID=66431 RepID=A0ABN3WDM2_STRTU